MARSDPSGPAAPGSARPAPLPVLVLDDPLLIPLLESPPPVDDTGAGVGSEVVGSEVGLPVFSGLLSLLLEVSLPLEGLSSFAAGGVAICGSGTGTGSAIVLTGSG